MRPVFLSVFLFTLQQLTAQGFTVSPFQDFSLSAPIIADFNGDNKPDVLGIQYISGPERIVLQINSSAPAIAFTEKELNLTIETSGQAAAADMDGDMDQDVVIAKGANRHLFMLQNDGLGNFTLDSLGVSGADILKIADFDNDTDPDIAGISIATGSLYLYVNDGNQIFFTKNILSNASNLELFDSGDVDDDGDTDIVLGFYQFSGKQIVLYKNNGGNNFEEKILVADAFSSISYIEITDINNDGKNDIIATNSFNCDGFINKGNLTFERKNLVGFNGLLRSLITGDYNGDGRKDIILGYNSVNMTWHKNLSNTTLEFSMLDVGSVTPVFSIANADLDGDNDTDIVVSNGEFWWYENGVQQDVSTISFPEADIRIYPNPFRDVLYVDYTGTDSYTIHITDITGKQVYAAGILTNTIWLPHLSPGPYFLYLTNTKTGQSRSLSLIKRE